MRSNRYLNWIRNQPCANCGSDGPVHAHHAIGTGDRGIGLKEWDLLAMPLCPSCHADLHRQGHESWELQFGITQNEIVLQMIKKAFFEGVIQIMQKGLRVA